MFEKFESVNYNGKISVIVKEDEFDGESMVFFLYRLNYLLSFKDFSNEVNLLDRKEKLEFKSLMIKIKINGLLIMILFFSNTYKEFSF